MVTTRYQEVRVPARRAGRCRVCGKRTVRSTTFSQTVSPFNRVADKSRPKTPAEVRSAVQAQADAWSPDPGAFDHGGCT